MKVVLFDLGQTLESNDVLLPGATAMLQAIAGLHDAAGVPVGLGLVSDFDMPATPAELPAIRQAYLTILTNLGIRPFFEPTDRCVTLSSDVGVFKPKAKIFRAALDRFGPDIPFADALFVTENGGHVTAARALGMQAVHFQGPGQTTGDITQLADLVPIVKAFVGTSDSAWGRFGDAFFHFGPASAARRTATGTAIPREHLHLVVQKGRSFQKAYPKVPVVHDRGRFLVVALDPAEARKCNHPTERSFAVQPLTDRHIAFRTRPRPSVRAAAVPWLQALVAQVTRASYEADLTHLVSFPTRRSTTTHYTAAAQWCADQLTALGYQVTQPPITVGAPTAHSCNVVAERHGQGPAPRDVVVVTAHLDSVNHDASDPLAAAPGADDNGSGSAGVLAIARALQNHPHVADVRFILFGGEEQGLFGSTQYVASLSAAERARVRVVVNMDMIGCLNRSPATVLLEGAPLAQSVIDGLAAAAETYTSLVIETSLNPFASDHVPFIEANMPAVLTIEGADQNNPNEHTDNDVLAKINYDIALAIVTMNVAYLAEQLGRVEP